MKKQYVKPALLCEELRPEELLCACSVTNPTFNEAQQCGYEPDGLGFSLFAQSWASCAMDNTGMSYYCYHNGLVLLFGS